ncbi:hypothetical protein PISMIDRAFT_687326 [Pisolithus microcarpus 441]|uniref:Uncharacterized protein n=1 Tax=Pisolithus microcarpus 441 TaxID=765257 RepID=A0A0C9Z626_9AGAM|nr:hypothetical protein PISMIDRAFT_687326 [Pisolithus microcarpus 441]
MHDTCPLFSELSTIECAWFRVLSLVTSRSSVPRSQAVTHFYILKIDAARAAPPQG